VPLLNLSSSRDIATLEKFVLALNAFLVEIERALATRSAADRPDTIDRRVVVVNEPFSSEAVRRQ
jgi:hypothetical protein